MKTVFLASGRSTRMDPISDKCLLEFGGVPLFLKLLRNAQAGGLENFIVVVNEHNQEEIETILKQENFPAQITQQKNLDKGMAGGISDGLELVDDNEPVFIHNGNDYINSNFYAEILEKSKNADGGILAKRMGQYFPGGYLKTDKNNQIEEIIEKPGEGSEPSNLVNIVAHLFQSAERLKTLLKKTKSSKDDLYEVVLQKLFQQQKFIAVEYDDFWEAIKYPWHVLNMMDCFLLQQKSHISDSAEIADSATIKGNHVIIEDGAKITENAVIQGPCYIGKNTIVGNNALVRNSMIGRDSVIGFNTEVARSFLHRNITTHFAYIGDSIVDEGVNFGAFSCTANLRLDQANVTVKIKEEKIDSHRGKLGAIIGKNAQIGIHAMLMPGIKVSERAIVFPGEVKK